MRIRDDDDDDELHREKDWVENGERQVSHVNKGNANCTALLNPCVIYVDHEGILFC